jgi:hypothetical protein
LQGLGGTLNRQSGAGRRTRSPDVANGYSVLLINLTFGHLYHLDSSLEVEGDDGTPRA